MQVNLHASDCCDRWKFYRTWLPGKTLAVHRIGVSKFNPTARNRMNYAIRHGYRAQCENWSEWNKHRDDIYRINTSAAVRQGNPMNPAYFDYPDAKTIDNPCPHHKYLLITVSNGGHWYAYAIIHVMGTMCNISTIIGHVDYNLYGIMPLLMSQIVESCRLCGVEAIDYGTWDSGTDGLRYFKHSTGFSPDTLTE